MPTLPRVPTTTTRPAPLGPSTDKGPPRRGAQTPQWMYSASPVSPGTLLFTYLSGQAGHTQRCSKVSQERGSQWPQARRLGSPPTTCQPQTDWGKRKAFRSSLVRILMLSLKTREPSLGRNPDSVRLACWHRNQGAQGGRAPSRGSAPPASGPEPAAGGPETLSPTTLPSSQHGLGVGFPTWHCHSSRSHINHCSRTKMKSPGLPKWE